MIATLTRMRVTGWRRTPNGLRWIGIPLGVLLGLTTVGVAGSAGDTDDIALLVAIIYAVWLTGWTVGPIQSGGAELLRPEWFALHPIPPRRLASGLLVAGFVGIGAVITLIASAGLVVFGARFSVAAAVVGVFAGLLQLLLMMTVSKLIAETLGASARSRIVLELTSIQYGLFIAVMFVGWFVIGQLADSAGAMGSSIGEVLPPTVRAVFLALPSGWGVVAVNATGNGNWLLAAAALVGLAILTWLGVVRWGHLLERRLTGPAGGGVSRPRGNAHRFLPTSPLGAVAAKDLRTWSRDPRRGVEVRSTLWSGVFIAAAAWAFAPEWLAFSGVAITVIGAMACVNVYAMDGTALWYTLLTPGATRSDVRGRQLSWLLIFIPASVIPSLIGLAIAPEAWTIPWVLALLPAMLGGGAGLIVWLSVVGLVPETDAHKRTGNPAETGSDATGLYFTMLFGVVILGAPAAAFLALSAIRGNAVLAWAAVGVGVVSGAAYVWGFGRVAIRHLEAQGPELLQKMRVGPPVGKKTTAGEVVESARDGWAVGLLTTVSMISIFPQGLISIGFIVLGGDDSPDWFLAPHLSSPWNWVVAVGFVALGLYVGWLALEINRRIEAAKTGTR